MMLLLGTPAVFSAAMTSRSSAIEVTVGGALDGLTLIATTSAGETNRAQASFGRRSLPVSEAMPA